VNPGDEYDHIAAVKGTGYLMVYTPLGNDIVLNGDLLTALSYQVSWFDPRSGKTLKAGTTTRKPVMSFRAPSRGPGFDWVLLLDETD